MKRQLLHSSIDDKGKIERWFRTVRAGWLSHLTAEATTSLDTLSRTLWAWVEGEYHQSPHRGLDGRAPFDQWALAGHHVRYPDPGLDLDDLFLFEAKRRVMKDRTVSLHQSPKTVSPHIPPTFVARASRCRCDKAHGPKERMRAAEGVVDTSATRC